MAAIEGLKESSDERDGFTLADFKQYLAAKMNESVIRQRKARSDPGDPLSQKAGVIRK